MVSLQSLAVALLGSKTCKATRQSICPYPSVQDTMVAQGQGHCSKYPSWKRGNMEATGLSFIHTLKLCQADIVREPYIVVRNVLLIRPWFHFLAAASFSHFSLEPLALPVCDLLYYSPCPHLQWVSWNMPSPPVGFQLSQFISYSQSLGIGKRYFKYWTNKDFFKWIFLACLEVWFLKFHKLLVWIQLVPTASNLSLSLNSF